MGTFDSFYDRDGLEWQTKAIGRGMGSFEIGQPIPAPLPDCQMQVIGGDWPNYLWEYATVRGGVLVDVPAARDDSLTLVEYKGFYSMD